MTEDELDEKERQIFGITQSLYDFWDNEHDEIWDKYYGDKEEQKQ